MLNKNDMVTRIRKHRFSAAASRPHILFGPGDLQSIRRRAADYPGLTERLVARARRHVETPGEQVNLLQTYLSSAELVDVANALVITPDAAMQRWLRARVFAMFTAKTWFAPVHVGACRVCDHCMNNTAAHIALAQDLVPDAFKPEDIPDVARRLRGFHLEPFLDATGSQPEWWFRPDMASNWKIMCCGEAGVAFCGYAEHFPEAPEAMARAAQGIVEVLDLVPPEGDWGEGVGYWFHTLWMGLRFARALRRVSGGKLDLFEHPVLKVTGDFLATLTTPAGRVYNFADCDPALGDIQTESLAMLAADTRRGDWMRVARMAPAASPLFLACDDPAIRSEPSTRKVAAFPATGAASLRTGWGPGDVFVGFKSGPSTVGHSHLDQNSFMIEAGGQRLCGENPYWPQAHFIGFFDMSEFRWNFDGMATVGHSTFLVDGKGQTWGPDYAGRLGAVQDMGRYQFVTGDASRCYPGLLKKFIRTLVLIPPDRIVIRDVVECEGERHIEWLMQHEGEVRSEGIVSVIENGGVRLVVTPFLPDRQQGWRWNDATRTSVYVCSDTMQEVTRAIRYRGFSTFRAADRFEFLFGMRVNGTATGDWDFRQSASGWELGVSSTEFTVRAKDEGLVGV